MSEYRLFSWGANSHGQLAQGADSPEELLTPQEVALHDLHVNLSELIKIVGGAGHTLLLDSSGRLFECGRHQQFNSPASPESSSFRKLSCSFGGSRLVDVACGWDASMALDEDGRVFGWGSNAHGQLGSLGDAVENFAAPIEGLPPVRKLAMGLRHSAVVTRDSKLFVSGAGAKGQLGVELDPGVRCSRGFVLVPGLEDISDVACGQHHTVAITNSGRVFAWGDNKHGQLGIDPKIHSKVSLPTEIHINAGSLNSVHCGWTHTTVLTSDGRLITWGRNSYGQLGRKQDTLTAESWKVKILEVSPPVKQLSVGSEHSIALREDGIVVSWGWNEHGNCGNGNKEDVFRPTEVSLPEGSGTLVGTGAGHSFAVVKVG